jgi:hypothetical protein
MGIKVIWVGRQAIFPKFGNLKIRILLRKGLDRKSMICPGGQIKLIRLDKSLFWRTVRL